MRMNMEKETESSLEVTMVIYDGAKICELVGFYILMSLATIVKKPL